MTFTTIIRELVISDMLHYTLSTLLNRCVLRSTLLTKLDIFDNINDLTPRDLSGVVTPVRSTQNETVHVLSTLKYNHYFGENNYHKHTGLNLLLRYLHFMISVCMLVE